MVNINGIEYPTLMPDEFFEKKFAEQEKIIKEFLEKYKELHKDDENNPIELDIDITAKPGEDNTITLPTNIDDTIITATIDQSQGILNGTKCMHLVNITYDNATQRYVSYCSLCGKILDSQSLKTNKDNKPRMLSESKITKIGKKDKNNIKKDKDNNTRK